MSTDTQPSSRSSHLTAWFLAVALATVLVLPLITRRGIFLDGLVYATISRNMALSVGDFWHPIYAGVRTDFRDSPPLGFWFESLAFRLLGDHWWVEKLYSVLTAVLTGGIIVATWRWLTRRDRRLQDLAWLPIALWITVPCWQWTVLNNMLENTMSVFTAAAVYCSLRALPSPRWWSAWMLGAAACIVAAVMTKGPVGLFPLAAPLCAWVCFREPLGPTARRTKTVWLQLLLLLLVAAGAGLLLLQPACREYLHLYWQNQLVASLKGERETNPSIIGQAQILWEVFMNILASIVFAAGMNWWARRRRPPMGWVPGPLPEIRRAAVFSLLMGLAASCPVVVSPKQTGFYVFPSYPFYVLAMALWSAESVEQIRATLSEATLALVGRWLRRAAVGALVVTLALTCLWHGKPRRDLREIQIAQTISRFVPSHTSIDIPEEIASQWALLGYLKRYHFIDLENRNARREFRLELQDSGSLPPGYERVAAEMPRYRLLRRTELVGSDRAGAGKTR